MNPRLMTLEQMEEREANRIAFQKAKAESAIAKLSERAKNADEKEAERLNNIIANHQALKDELETADVATLASTRFTAIQQKLSGRTIIKDPVIDIKEEPLIGK